MSAIAYTVTATLPDDRTLEEYIAWLRDGHVAEVVACGAESAMIVRLDREPEGEPRRVEARYVFASRESFDDYVTRHAPALRADGLRKFPAERGIRFQRTVGEIV